VCVTRDNDIGSALAQKPAQVRPNEPAATGHERAHR
jgi:hypothetical protein